MIVNILDNTPLNFASENYVLQLKNISSEYFQFFPEQEIDIENSIRENSKLFSYKLPPNLNEIFIKFENSPLYWLNKTSLSLYLEEFTKLYFPHGFDTSFLRIKDFYSKWINIKTDNEKKYFASSVISLIEKNPNKKNFINLIYHSIILAYDKNYSNIPKAIELLQEAGEITESVKIKAPFDVEIKYLIKLYEGFFYLQLDQLENAATSFNNSLFIKPYGITAKFYLALLEVLEKRDDSAKFLLKEILAYDVYRVEFAVEKNNMILYKYFIKNSIFKNIFYYYDFAYLSDYVKEILIEIKKYDKNYFDSIKLNFVDFQKQKLNEYYTDKISPNISFLEKYFQQLASINNILTFSSFKKIEEKFCSIIKDVKDSIVQKYYSEIKQKLSDFDYLITSCMENINVLSRDMEEDLKKLKENLTSGLTRLDKSADKKIEMIQDKINNLQNDKSVNAGSAFSSTMTYTVIISVVVFLVAGYSGSFMANEWEFSDIITNVFYNGFKWGIITFLIGVLISVLAAGFVMVEKVNKKQKLTQLISDIKNSRDIERNYLKREVEQQEAYIKEGYTVEIENYKERIKKVKAEKDLKENSLNKEADKIIIEITSKLENYPPCTGQS